MAEHDAGGREGGSANARGLGAAGGRSPDRQDCPPSHAEHLAGSRETMARGPGTSGGEAREAGRTGPLGLLAALQEVEPCDLFRVVERFLGGERRPPRVP